MASSSAAPAAESSSPAIPKLEIRASTPPPGGLKAKPKLSSQVARAASAGKVTAPPSPLTPRQKKATRSLFKELGSTARCIAHMQTRTTKMHQLISGQIKELQAAAEGAQRSLTNNFKMVAATKDTGSKASPAKSGSGLTPRPFNPTEIDNLTAELRDKLWASGEERFPTDYELEQEMQSRLEAKKLSNQSAKRRNSKANKPIVEALEKLGESSSRLALELATHEEQLRKQIDLLDEVWRSLKDHEEVRDQIFDPKFSNPKIKRSVLYQKTNPMQPVTLDLDDKNQESSQGKNKYGSTGHEACSMAAEREDVARAACTRAHQAQRAAATELALRKSALQVSVRTSREMVMKAWRASKTGKFGSSEERNTDPSAKKGATNPDDTE